MELRRSGWRGGGGGGGARLAALFCCCTFICFIPLFALLGSGQCRNVHLGVRTLRRYSSVQEAPAAAGRRRELIGGGPGSYPPRCMAKCGDCTPCNPVHVAVPPGTPVTTEYYPEAWRCKCGNKLYMP